MSRRTVQRVEVNPLRGNPLAEIAVIGQCHHGVPKTLRRQGIEQVDHAVLHAAGIETVDDMHDVCGHCPPTRSSPRAISGSMSAAKRARVAAAVLRSAFWYGVAISTDRPSSRVSL